MDKKKRVLIAAMDMVGKFIQEDKDFRCLVAERAGLDPDSDDACDLVNEAVEAIGERLIAFAALNRGGNE